MQGAISSFAFLFLRFFYLTHAVHLHPSIYVSVYDYGAVGDGKTDDSLAFNKAWTNVCNYSASSTYGDSSAVLDVPPGKTFLLNPVIFRGPCNVSSIHFQLRGTLIASQNTSWADDGVQQWIKFSGINNLIIDGSGTIDGQGSIWWQPCKKKNTFGSLFQCDERPAALRFININGLQLDGITHLNSPKIHISITGCNDVNISNLQITAPEDSPNTDGIDISHSQNINIQNSRIGTGDDCIAINGGVSSMYVSGIQCGPGHGLSIGSLGDGDYDTVENVHIERSSLSGTQNGVRIKTIQGASGYARGIYFENIKFDNVKNPIIINQFYVDKGKNHPKSLKEAAIQISNVTYSGIQGTSASETAINLNCSNVVACTGIVLENIAITSADSKQNVHSYCNNAQETATTVQPAVQCRTPYEYLSALLE